MSEEEAEEVEPDDAVAEESEAEAVEEAEEETEESETEESEEEQAAYEVVVDGQSQEVTLKNFYQAIRGRLTIRARLKQWPTSANSWKIKAHKSQRR